MDVLQQYGKEIFSIAVPLLTWWLNYFYKAKAKLKAANPHSFSFLIKEPLRDEDGKTIQDTQIAHTKSFLVRNVGREPATKVEFVLNWQPQFFNLWPSRHYTCQTQEDGRFVIIFDSLSPGEMIGIELLSVNRDLPTVINIRSDQSKAQFVEMIPMETISQFKLNVFRALVILGFSAAIYLSIQLAQFLILKTA
ncbi:hypothetical protein ACX3X6_01040 [Pseudomonas sichuanensis]